MKFVKRSAQLSILIAVVSTILLAQVSPVPFINQPLVPTSAPPGGSNFTLTVNGSGFVSGSLIEWNGNALSTSFMSSSQLTANVPGLNIANANTAAISVINPSPGGGTSNAVLFDVSNPISSLTFATFKSVAYFAPLVAGDFNGDGKTDLAWVGVNGNSRAICVQLGNGDGSFEVPQCSAENFGTLNSMIVADLNGDRKIDLVGTDVNGIHVWLGNGDGTFQIQRDLTAGPSGSQPSALVAADFNGDGKLDLGVANAPNEAGASGSVSILLGNGDGTFQPHVDYAPEISTLQKYFSLAAGDFNGDNKLDLVTNNIIVFGHGDGTFGSPQSLPITAEQQIIASDVNNDGLLDLIGLSPVSQNVFVLLGNGDGTFQSPINHTDKAFPVSAIVADVDADGKVDLVLLNNASPAGSVSILLGNGDGTFQASQDFPTGPNPNSFVASDFNNDGKMDLAAIAQDSQSILNLNVLLQGQWPALQAEPPNLIFSQQAIGTTSAAQTFDLTNTGNKVLNISSIVVSGADAGDFAQTNTCGSTLAQNESCQVNVTFTPTSSGDRNAAISATDDSPGSPQTFLVAGGTPPAPIASISPNSLSFPIQYVGTSGLPQIVTLSNTGTGPLSISSVTVSGADFAPLSTCGNTVAAGANCSIGVFFDPTTTGSRVGTLSISDSASDTPQTVSLTGTGQDFSLVASGSSVASIIAGQTANYTVAISPAGGFARSVSLTCVGAPAQSTCSISPNTIVLNGSSPALATVSVLTPSTLIGMKSETTIPPTHSEKLRWFFAGTICITMLIGLFGLPQTYLRCIVLLLSIATISSCGGGRTPANGGGGTNQSQAFNLTVVGTFSADSTTLTHNTQLTLIVQ